MNNWTMRDADGDQLRFATPDSQVVYYVQLENGLVATNPYTLQAAQSVAPADHEQGRVDHSEVAPEEAGDDQPRSRKKR